MAKNKKKKNKKGKKGSLYSSFNFRSGKDSKKKKKVKGTLSKKDLKARDKEIRKTAVMPVLEENAAKCNHANVKKYMTVEQFGEHVAAKYGANHAAFLMSRIDTTTSVFSTDKIRICPDCYEAIVDVQEIVDSTDPVAIMASLQAIKNAVVFRAKEKKVELVNEEYRKIEKNLDELFRQYNKLIADLDDGESTKASSSSRGDDSDDRFQSNQ